MIAAAALHIRDLTNETAGHVGAPALKASARVATARSQQAAAALSKIMVEAHARAKADYADELSCRGRAHHVDRPYRYYLALQMRSGFAEARVARTGMASAFELPPQRWA